MTKRTIFISTLLPALIAVLGLIPGALPARAQAPSTGFGLGAINVPGGEKARTGNGLKFGRSEFHAGLSVEAGWDSNVYYDDAGEVSSAYLRLFPQLTLGTRPVAQGKRQKFAYNLALAMDYIGYLQDLNGSKRHHVGATLGLDLKFNPQGKVAFSIVEQFTRTNEPRAGQTPGSIDRDYNQAGFDLIFRNGLLSFLLGYRFVIDMYEQKQYDVANRMLHEAKFKADWKFFPQTAFWFQAESGYVDYFEDNPTVGVPNRSSAPLKLMIGATGRLTPWMTADIGIGYGMAYYIGQPLGLHHDVIANVGLGFKMGPYATLKLGYQHGFKDSVVGDFYKEDSAYARLNLALFKRLVVEAMVAWTMADYQRYVLPGASGGSCDANGVCDRKDNYLIVGVSADYYFLSWLSLGIGYSLQGNFTGFSTDFAGFTQIPSFVKHRVYGRITAYY
ncbi:MAG: outer membrane beta-barrel protein [bacterium]